MTYEEIERRFGPYSGPLGGWTESELRSMYFSGLISRATALRYHQISVFVNGQI